MCDACYGLVHDMLVTPLALENPMRPYVHQKSLLAAGPAVAECFAHIVHHFKYEKIFFITPDMLLYDMDIFSKMTIEAEFIHKKMTTLYRRYTTDFNAAVDICLDHNVFRKTVARDQLAKQFLMIRLTLMLKTIPEIHHNHMTKPPYINASSPGPVPAWKIAQVKAKARGLPPPPPPIYAPPTAFEITEAIEIAITGRCSPQPLRIRQPRVEIEEDALYY